MSPALSVAGVALDSSVGVVATYAVTSSSMRFSASEAETVSDSPVAAATATPIALDFVIWLSAVAVMSTSPPATIAASVAYADTRVAILLVASTPAPAAAPPKPAASATDPANATVEMRSVVVADTRTSRPAVTVESLIQARTSLPRPLSSCASL